MAPCLLALLGSRFVFTPTLAAAATACVSELLFPISASFGLTGMLFFVVRFVSAKTPSPYSRSGCMHH